MVRWVFRHIVTEQFSVVAISLSILTRCFHSCRNGVRLFPIELGRRAVFTLTVGSSPLPQLWAVPWFLLGAVAPRGLNKLLGEWRLSKLLVVNELWSAVCCSRVFLTPAKSPRSFGLLTWMI